MAELRYWDLSSRSRFSRRRVLSASALGATGLLAAAGVSCSSSSSKPANNAPGSAAAPASSAAAGAAPSAAASQPQAKRGGALVQPWALGGGNTKPFDAGLDPHPLQPDYTGAMSMFYQMLLHLNPRTAAVEPMLAQKWEQPDATTFLFHLQPNVKFHNKPPANGRLLTADDVVFSLNRIGTNDPKFQNRALVTGDKFEAVDKATVKLTMPAPNVSTLILLAGFSFAILAPEVVEKAGKFSTADTAVGTGPFMLQSYDDTAATMVRNPDYWKPGLPYLDSVRRQAISDQNAQWAAFRAGQVQTTCNPLSGPDAKQVFDQQQGKDYAAEWYKDVSFPSVEPNVKHKPFDDPRVDRALRLMIDHNEAVNNWAITWFGKGYMSLFLPAALEDWDYTEQEYTSKFLEFKNPKDDAVKEALSLLNAAGYSKDNPLKFTLTGFTGGFAQNEAELHQAQINKFGQGAVQCTNLSLYELAQLNVVLAQGNFDYFSGNHGSPAQYDVDSWLTTIYRTGGGRNNGNMSDPTLDALIDKQRTIADVAQRKAAVKQIIDYMMDHSPYSSWSGRQVLNVYSRKVHNFAPEGSAAVWGFNYEQVWME